MKYPSTLALGLSIASGGAFAQLPVGAPTAPALPGASALPAAPSDLEAGLSQAMAQEGALVDRIGSAEMAGVAILEQNSGMDLPGMDSLDAGLPGLEVPADLASAPAAPELPELSGGDAPEPPELGGGEAPELEAPTSFPVASEFGFATEQGGFATTYAADFPNQGGGTVDASLGGETFSLAYGGSFDNFSYSASFAGMEFSESFNAADPVASLPDAPEFP